MPWVIIAPDTIAHFVFYFVMCFLLILSFQRSTEKSNAKHFLYSFIISVIYGYTIELAQGHLIPGRFYDIYDVYTNTTGSLFGIAFLIVSRKLKPNFESFLK